MSLERLLSDLSIESGIEGVIREVRERLEERDPDTPGILARAAELFRISPVSRLFPEFSADLRGAYTHLVISCTRHAALPLCDSDSGTLPASSYEQIPGKALAVGGALLALTARLGEAVRTGDPGARALIHTVSPVLCVFSITHLQEQPWTDPSSRECGAELLEVTVSASGRGSLQDLLCGGGGGGDPGILGSILDTLQPDMTK